MGDWLTKEVMSYYTVHVIHYIENYVLFNHNLICNLIRVDVSKNIDSRFCHFFILQFLIKYSVDTFQRS